MASQSTHTEFFRFVIRAALLIPITGLLMAPTCDQSFSGTSGSGPAVTYKAFGDSIPSGNLNSGSSHGRSYVHDFSDDIAASNGWRVSYDAKTVAGETTSQIRSTILSNTSKMAAADILTFNAGGNDLLDARDDFGTCGSQSGLANDVANWRAAWDSLIQTVATYAPSDAMVRTMTIYYPDPDTDRGVSCSGRTRFEWFLPHGLAASHYMCATAEEMGWRCADAMEVMNCDEDEPRCPNIAYLNALEANGCPRVGGGMMDHNCIRAHLDAMDDWAFFKDPRRVVKDGVEQQLTQSGDIHPNGAGHDRIGAAHHALGYDDCGACPQPPACGDGSCNGTENAASCPADCPAVCGDNLCTGAENASTCATDCPDVCGDSFCTGAEDCNSCGSDCGACPSCGDGSCNGSEDCNSCSSDCGACPLGIYETGISGGDRYYTLEVPSNGDVVTIVISGGSGDCDLHVKRNGSVSTSNHDCRPYRNGNNETCTFTGGGTYSILLDQYSSYSGVTLDASYTTKEPEVCGDGTCTESETCGNCESDCGVCPVGINETNLSVSSGSWTAVYTLQGNNPTFRMSGGSGDADLYVRLGSPPTTSSYNCRPYNSGNNETCNMSGNGTWYVAVRGYSSSSGFNLWSE